MDQQTVDLVREVLNGLSETAKPLWAETVEYVRWVSVAELVSPLVLIAIALRVCLKFKEIAESRDRYEREGPLVVCVLAGSVAGIVLIIYCLAVPGVIGAIASPEGYLVKQAISAAR